MREQLTKIYQRHCAKDGEAVEEGLARFGTYHNHFTLANTLMVAWCIEKALERDYFLTGTLTYFSTIDPGTLTMLLAANEALDFGIVDSVLEKRPESESNI